MKLNNEAISTEEVICNQATSDGDLDTSNPFYSPKSDDSEPEQVEDVIIDPDKWEAFLQSLTEKDATIAEKDATIEQQKAELQTAQETLNQTKSSVEELQKQLTEAIAKHEAEIVATNQRHEAQLEDYISSFNALENEVDEYLKKIAEQEKISQEWESKFETIRANKELGALIDKVLAGEQVSLPAITEKVIDMGNGKFPSPPSNGNQIISQPVRKAGNPVITEIRKSIGLSY